MLRQVLFVGRKDLLYTMRERETLVWMFIMPIVLIFFIGKVTSNFSSSGTTRDPLAVWQEGDLGFLGERLLQRLEERGYRIDRPATLGEFTAATPRLAVPAALTDSLLAGHPVKLRLTASANPSRGDLDRLRVSRAAYTLLADLVVTQEAGAARTPATLARLDSLPRALQVEVQPAGKRTHIPTGFEQAVPGIMVMFVLLVMTTGGAVMLFTERRQGLLRRLAYTPIPRLAVVLGKWLGKMGIGSIQIAFAMLAGTLLFGMNWGPNLGTLLLLMLAYAALMATVGIILGSLVRSEGQSIAIGVVSSNVLGALGGCWWPIEVVPQWMQKLQLFIPTGWAMNGLHKLVSFAAEPSSVVPHVLGMLAATAVLLVVSARVFRFE